MYLNEAIDEIRAKLAKHRLATGKFLWPTIIQQIAKQNAFDGAHAATILETIRSFLQPLDAATILSFWRETEVGMGDDMDHDRLFPDDLRMDVEMELLQQVTDLAWYEATGRWPKHRSFDDPEPDWD